MCCAERVGAVRACVTQEEVSVISPSRRSRIEPGGSYTREKPRLWWLARGARVPLAFRAVTWAGCVTWPLSWLNPDPDPPRCVHEQMCV